MRRLALPALLLVLSACAPSSGTPQDDAAASSAASSTASSAAFCGGIAAIRCPAGQDCRLEGDFPDAGGVCVPSAGPSI